MSNVFEQVFEEAMEHAPDVERNPGDFMGADGLLHCGECGEAKEFRNPLPAFMHAKRGEYAVLKRECRCERDERELSERKALDAAMAERREAVRDECFPYAALKAATFDADDMANPGMTKVCRRFVERFDDFERMGAGLILYGAVGGGKTFHAACIANGVIDGGKTAVFTSLSTLGARMQADYGSRRLAILEKLCSYDLVVLDDLGVERGTETMNENVYQIVNALYSSKTVLIITTNMSAEAMQEETNPNLQRIYSRIFECCQPVEVKGEDRRRDVSEEKARLYMSLSE